MKDISGKIVYKETEYRIVFNLNVMEAIQEEYGTIQRWSDLVSDGEGDAKAIKFGFAEMLNEGIDLMNEENGTELKPFTLRQVGRILSDIGFKYASELLAQTVEDSTESEQKNA